MMGKWSAIYMVILRIMDIAGYMLNIKDDLNFEEIETTVPYI